MKKLAGNSLREAWTGTEAGAVRPINSLAQEMREKWQILLVTALHRLSFW
jgi:hypothetical protein